MATALAKGSMFPEKVVSEIFTKVKGHSSLAKLSEQIPVSFNGNELFTFSMDNEVDIVAESGKKTNGGATAEPVKITPVKIEYGARVTDEFLYATEEEQLEILKTFNDGCAKKIARGIDIMALHGVNPRTGSASGLIGTNHFDTITKTAIYDAAAPDTSMEDAITLLDDGDAEVTGAALAGTMRSALARMKVNGVKQYPELAWGSNPGMINGLPVDVNSTVSFGSSKDMAVVGDFRNAFKWGYAKQVPFEVIEYGDPDGTGKDLKNYNQVYLRAEAYVGWAILDKEMFARVITE